MPGFDSITGDETIVSADNVSFDGTRRGGKITTDGQILIGSTTTPHIRVGSLTSTDGSVVITPGHGTINLSAFGVNVNQDQIVYVGKHGNDANSGLNIENAKLTFGAAITAAAAIQPAVVVCFDDGTYTENLTGQSGVNIFATNCTLNGNHVMAGGNSWTLGIAGISSGTGFTFNHIGNEGKLNCRSLICDTNASGVSVTSGYLDLEVIESSVVNGNLLNCSTTNAAYLNISRCTIHGSGSFINCTGTSEIIAICDVVTDNGGSGTLVQCTNVASTINILASEVNIANLSNIGALPNVRISVAGLLGTLAEIGSGTIDAISGSTKIENVPIGASTANSGRFTTLAATLTSHGILMGNGTSGAIQATSELTDGQLLIGSAGNFPVPASLSSLDGSVVITPGAGTIDLSATAPATSRVAFSTYLQTPMNNVTGTGTNVTILFDTVLYDLNSNYNSGTGTFTAPVSGIYTFSASATTIGGTLAYSSQMEIVPSSGPIFYIRDEKTPTSGGGLLGCTRTVTISLTALDTVYVTFYAYGEASDNCNIYGAAAQSWTSFSGQLIALT